MSSVREDYEQSRREEQEKEAAQFADREGEFIVLKTEFDGIIDWKFDAVANRFNACFKKTKPYGGGKYTKEEIQRYTKVSQIGLTYTSYRSAVQAAIGERDSNEWFDDDGEGLWTSGPPYDSRENRNVENDTEYLIEVVSKADYDKRQQKESRKQEDTDGRPYKRARQDVDAEILFGGARVWIADFTVDGGESNPDCRGGILHMSNDVQKINAEALKIMAEKYNILLEDNLKDQALEEKEKEKLRSMWYNESTGGLAVNGYRPDDNDLIRVKVVPLTPKTLEKCNKTVLFAPPV